MAPVLGIGLLSLICAEGLGMGSSSGTGFSSWCLYIQESIANLGMRNSFGFVQRFGKAGRKVKVL